MSRWAEHKWSLGWGVVEQIHQHSSRAALDLITKMSFAIRAAASTVARNAAKGTRQMSTSMPAAVGAAASDLGPLLAVSPRPLCGTITGGAAAAEAVPCLPHFVV